MGKRVPRQPVAREALPKAARAAMGNRAAARAEVQRRLREEVGAVPAERVLSELALAFAPTREVLPLLKRLSARLRVVQVAELDAIGRGLNEAVARLDPRVHFWGGLPEDSPKIYWRRLVAATAHLAEHIDGMNQLVARARRELDPRAVDRTATCRRLGAIHEVGALRELPTLLALAGVGLGDEPVVRSQTTYAARVDAWALAWKRHGAASDKPSARRIKLSDRA